MRYSRSTPAPVRRKAALLAAALLLPAAARAQSPAAAPAPAGGLTLEEVVRATLAANPGIQIGRRDVDAAQGALLSARGGFDPRLETVVAGGRDERHALTSAGEITAQPVITNSASYAVSLSTLTRFGVSFRPSVEVSRTANELAPPTANSASVNLAVDVPLLRDRFGRATVAPERAARAGYDAGVLALRHQTATSLREAASAFWGYLAAQRRLEVYRGSEERAERLTEETRALVAADERPAADLNQLRANLASKRIARINAEQEVVAARRRLGLAMGASAAEVGSLAAPAGDFPAPVPFAADSAAVGRMAREAVARRADLAQSAAQLRSAEALADASASGLLPRLDLSVGVGYTGLQTGAGFGAFALDPLYSHVPGLTTSLRVDYQMPVTNADARGRAMQRRAEVERQRVARADLERRVATAVEATAQALARSALTLEEARGSIELYRTTVQNERKKNDLGASTLFDVLLAEDNLTNASLVLVSTQLNYAQAVLDLRFETATLLEGEGADATVRVAALLAPR